MVLPGHWVPNVNHGCSSIALALRCQQGGIWPAGLVSVDHLGDGALHRLQSERQEWHADLDSLLEGNFASEDLDLAITLAK